MCGANTFHGNVFALGHVLALRVTHLLRARCSTFLSSFAFCFFKNLVIQEHVVRLAHFSSLVLPGCIVFRHISWQYSFSFLSLRLLELSSDFFPEKLQIFLCSSFFLSFPLPQSLATLPPPLPLVSSPSATAAHVVNASFHLDFGLKWPRSPPQSPFSTVRTEVVSADQVWG